MHVSPAHPANDPRIVYKQIPALAEHYNIICLLPGSVSSPLPASVQFIGLPRLRWLGWRLLVIHPLILWHILRFRPIVLHIYMPELLPVALLCRAILGLKVVYEVQENLRLKFDRKPYNNHWLFQRFFDWFDRRARQSCYFIFTDDSYLNTYTNLRLPTAIVHNYPDVSLMRTLIPPSREASPQPEFVYLGLVSLDRGLDTMIKAIALLKPSYPAIRLHLFGRCMFDPEQLERIPAFSSLRDHLVFYDQTDYIKALPIAARCTAGLALLKPVGDYPESYPTKIFEYMALGLPVIASNFPLYKRLVEGNKCGVCINPEQADELATQLNKLLSNRQEAQQMGQNGYTIVQERFSWAQEKTRLLNLYKEIK